MHKKIFYISFASLILILALTLKPTQLIQAEDGTTSPTPTGSLIQYNLAFPGILPDNFLYKVKVLRDKIQLVMTTDSKKRIDLLLQFADKGILAGAILIDKKEWNLAKETLLKAENNMTLLVPEISRLDDPIDQKLIKKLQTASQKHQEIFAKLQERAPDNYKSVFAQVNDFSKRNQSEIEKFVEQ